MSLRDLLSPNFLVQSETKNNQLTGGRQMASSNSKTNFNDFKISKGKESAASVAARDTIKSTKLGSENNLKFSKRRSSRIMSRTSAAAMMSDQQDLTRESLETSPVLVHRQSMPNETMVDSTVNKSLVEDTEAIQIVNNKKGNGQLSMK